MLCYDEAMKHPMPARLLPYLSTFGITVTLAAALVIGPKHTALWEISSLMLAATGGLGDTSEPHRCSELSESAEVSHTCLNLKPP